MEKYLLIKNINTWKRFQSTESSVKNKGAFQPFQEASFFASVFEFDWRKVEMIAWAPNEFSLVKY